MITNKDSHLYYVTLALLLIFVSCTNPSTSDTTSNNTQTQKENRPPKFTPTAYFTTSVAVQNTAYHDSIKGKAVDVDDDPLTYSKHNGPKWLSIDSDGTLTGRPLADDVGVNVFSVEVSDRTHSTKAILYIPVGDKEYVPGKQKNNITLSYDGLDWTYDLFVPGSYNKVTPTPLIIDMHGLGGTTESQRSESGWKDLAEVEGFIVAWPQEYTKSWNCGFPTGQNTDDVGFIKEVIKKIRLKYNIDKTRVYATGHSIGGSMSHFLGVYAEDIFAAIAPYAQHALINFTSTDLSRPISVVQTHSIDDSLVSYYGGMNSIFPSAESSITKWKNANGCTDRASIKTWNHDSENYCMTYQTCNEGVEVTLCTVQGDHSIYHNVPGVHLVTETGWDYLKKYKCLTCNSDTW